MNDECKVQNEKQNRGTAPRSALVLFAHGARDPEWAEPFRAIAARVAGNRKDLAVRLAFLEFQTPTLADAIAELAAAGYPAIRMRQPALSIELLPAIGDVDCLRDAIAGWLIAAVPGTPA